MDLICRQMVLAHLYREGREEGREEGEASTNITRKM